MCSTEASGDSQRGLCSMFICLWLVSSVFHYCFILYSISRRSSSATGQLAQSKIFFQGQLHFWKAFTRVWGYLSVAEACQTFTNPKWWFSFQGKRVIAAWPLETVGVVLLILLYFIGVCMTVCTDLCTWVCVPIHVHVEARGLVWCSLPYWRTDWLIHWIGSLSEPEVHCFNKTLGTACLRLLELGL